MPSISELQVTHRLGGEGDGTLLQYSCLENPMDGGAWWAAVLGVTKSQTWLSNFTFTFHFHALERDMATHSSVVAWRIPGTGELVGLLSMGSHRVGHNWSDLAAAAADVSFELPKWFSGKESTCQCRRHRKCGLNPWVRKIPWSRKWQPAPVVWPGKFHWQRSLTGYCPLDL